MAKVTAIDQYLTDIFHDRYQFFNEGGGYADYIGEYNESYGRFKYDLRPDDYGLASRLINEFEFHGVEAYTTVEAGNETGAIIVNRDGTEYVYPLNDQEDIFGTFKFYH